MTDFALVEPSGSQPFFPWPPHPLCPPITWVTETLHKKIQPSGFACQILKPIVALPISGPCLSIQTGEQNGKKKKHWIMFRITARQACVKSGSSSGAAGGWQTTGEQIQTCSQKANSTWPAASRGLGSPLAAFHFSGTCFNMSPDCSLL